MSDNKFKVPNPFSLISSFLPKKKKDEAVYEIESEEPNEKKSKAKKRGNINFHDEVMELGFSFSRQKDNYSCYKYLAIPTLFLFWNTETNYISMYYEKKLLSQINFVPNNRLFIEMFIRKTIENLK